MSLMVCLNLTAGAGVIGFAKEEFRSTLMGG